MLRHTLFVNFHIMQTCILLMKVHSHLENELDEKLCPSKWPYK